MKTSFRKLYSPWLHLFVWFHDDGNTLAGDLSEHLQGVHGLLSDGGVRGGDLSHQVMRDHMERLVLGSQQLLCLFLIFQRSGTAHQQLLQGGLSHGDCSI